MNGSDFFTLLHIAKVNLCYARFYRQLAQEAKDFRDMNEFHEGLADWELLDQVREIYARNAKESRLAVKSLLKELEIQNGQWLTQGLGVMPLQPNLNGKRFKDWPEYDAALNDLADRLPCDRWSQ